MFYNIIYALPWGNGINPIKRAIRTFVIGIVCYLAIYSLFSFDMGITYMMIITQMRKWFWIIFACDIGLLALQVGRSSNVFDSLRRLYTGEPQLAPKMPLDLINQLPLPPPPPEKKEPPAPLPPCSPEPEPEDSEELDIDLLTEDEAPEPPKTVKEPPKPVQEPPKTVKEPPKPVQEPPKPVQEQPVPVPEPEPTQELPTPVTESQRLTQENLDRYNTNKSKIQVDPSVKSQDLNL